MSNNIDIDFDLIDRVTEKLKGHFIMFDKKKDINNDTLDKSGSFTYKDCVGLVRLGILQSSLKVDIRYVAFNYKIDWKETLLILKRNTKINSIITE